MNRPPALNFLFATSDTEEMGSVATASFVKVLRPATFALWCVLTAGQAIALVTTGKGASWTIVFLSTLVFAAVHVQFWYEESEQGRKLHYAVDRVRGRIYEDDSTGLPNSRHFVFELRRQMMRSMRNGRGFSLILTNLNGLGKNETERALPATSRAMRHAVGDGDFVAHLEGAVFAAIVSDDREQTAADKSDAIHSALQAMVPPEQTSTVHPVVALTGYQGELEVRDFLRRAQRDLLGARSRGGSAAAPIPMKRRTEERTAA